MMKIRLAAAAACSLVAALLCSPPAAAASTAPASKVGAPRLAAAANGAWTTYHRDDARTGFDSTAPSTAGATTGWVSPALDGQVYGEPLVYNGVVYVATLQNTVYALNQSSGAVLWLHHLGAPQTSGWQCGNVNPTGILGTGVIDVAQSRIYVVPFLAQYGYYYLFGLDLATGMPKLQTQLVLPGFDWTIEQQRGALAISTDGTHVYVPFGGRAGDCGPYHGYVAGVPTNGLATDETYETPSTASGIWAAGGVAVDASTGNVFFATGNAIPCDGAVNSDSVIRTNSALAKSSVSFFQPTDWFGNWCGPDLDLGSATPVLISPNLMFTSGKYGSGFLLNPNSLGGTSNGLYRADVCHGINSDATFGSFAYAAPFVYLECDAGGLVGLQVNTSANTFSQCAASCTSPSFHVGGSMTFGPPIVAGGAVWVVDVGTGTGLYAYDATTGIQIFHSASFGVNHFVTPSEAGGQVFVPSHNVVREFTIVPGCAQVTLAAAPPSPSPSGTQVTFTATPTGCPNPSPLFEFWMLAPGSASWQDVRPYSTSASFVWDSTGKVGGTYRFTVWARDANSPGGLANSLGRWDTSDNTLYSLTATPCTVAGLSASPPSATTRGTPVTFTATATCPHPSYQFWILAPGSSTWQNARPYATTPTFVWTTTGKALGTYRVTVWARDASSSGVHGNALGTWDDSSDSSYTLTAVAGCTGVDPQVFVPASPASRGTPVTDTANATGCPNPNPLYQFWVLAPGSGTWQIARPYSTAATFTWPTTGKAAGTYRITVWVRDASSPGALSNSLGTWDTSDNSTYTLS